MEIVLFLCGVITVILIVAMLFGIKENRIHRSFKRNNRY